MLFKPTVTITYNDLVANWGQQANSCPVAHPADTEQH